MSIWRESALSFVHWKRSETETVEEFDLPGSEVDVGLDLAFEPQVLHQSRMTENVASAEFVLFEQVARSSLPILTE